MLAALLLPLKRCCLNMTINQGHCHRYRERYYLYLYLCLYRYCRPLKWRDESFRTATDT